MLLLPEAHRDIFEFSVKHRFSSVTNIAARMDEKTFLQHLHDFYAVNRHLFPTCRIVAPSHRLAELGAFFDLGFSAGPIEDRSDICEYLIPFADEVAFPLVIGRIAAFSQTVDTFSTNYSTNAIYRVGDRAPISRPLLAPMSPFTERFSRIYGFASDIQLCPEGGTVTLRIDNESLLWVLAQLAYSGARVALQAGKADMAAIQSKLHHIEHRVNATTATVYINDGCLQLVDSVTDDYDYAVNDILRPPGYQGKTVFINRPGPPRRGRVRLPRADIIIDGRRE